ncbi:hypothetical protein [Verminephrobacter aporrectodeae]|nr:hypothetical protein [Verminephrobacter aporrectodeae]
MTTMTTMTTMTPPPKSYITDARREEMRAGGLDQDGIYVAESVAAGAAGDRNAAWGWLARAELYPQTLMGLKRRNSAQFIRDMGFKTAKADAFYGPGWLDRDDL